MQIKPIKLVLLTILMTVILFSAYSQKVLHVAPDVPTNGNGTLKSPFKTIQQAQKVVAGMNSNMKEDIIIYWHGGTYNLTTPIIFKEEDSGTNGFNVIYKAYDNETPIISGGKQITGWEKVDGNIYKAKLDRADKLRTLFVNGKRMRMAGTDLPVNGLGNWGNISYYGDRRLGFWSWDLQSME